MTTRNLILMAGIIMALAFLVEAEAAPAKDVNVVNEPNVNVLNNVDVNITNDGNNPVPVTVLNGNNGAAEKELVEIIQLDVPSDTTIDIYTVPAGKKLLITDVIVHHGDSRFMEIHRNGTVVSRFRLTTTSTTTFGHSYISGIEFQEGDILSVRNGAGGANQNGFELRGYLTDVNGS